MANKLNTMIAKEIGDHFPKGTDYLVVSYSKLTGIETTELRKVLRTNKIHMEVVKNSIASRVLEANGIGGGVRFLKGPCALVKGETSLPEVAKVVTELAKKYEERISVRGGFMGDLTLAPDGVVKLASIPPMPVLRAMMIGSVQAPMTRVAGAFQSIARSMACALEAIREQKESSAPPSAPQTAASGVAPAVN